MIRPMDMNEADAVAQMACDLAAHHGDVGTLDADGLSTLVQDGWIEVLVHRQENTLSGYVALSRRMRLHEGQRGLHMEHLFVQKAHRGRGIGAALVTAAIKHARLLGCIHLAVGTAPDNPRAAAFYLRQGFTEPKQRGRHFSMAL